MPPAAPFPRFLARRFRLARAGVAASAAFLPLAACSSTVPVPAHIDTTRSALSAADVFPSTPQVKHYDPAPSTTIALRRTLTPVPADELPAAALPGLRVQSIMFDAAKDPDAASPIEDRHLELARAPDGAVLLLMSREGGRTVTFDPPVIYMPATLEPGQPFEHKATARVLGESGRQQTSGQVTRRIEYIGDDPAHPDSRLVHAQMELDLFPARVSTTTTFWVDARGIWREQQTTRVRVLGVLTETRKHDVILRDEPAPATPAGASP